MLLSTKIFSGPGGIITLKYNVETNKEPDLFLSQVISKMKTNYFIGIIALVVFGVCLQGIFTFHEQKESLKKKIALLSKGETDTVWRGAAASQIPIYSSPEGQQIYYGYQLISHTAAFLGPHGKVAPMANQLNCQNCHLDAGTRPFANNFGKVMSTYPQYRARNDKVQSLYDRINDCMVRSMNGKPLDTSSKEIKAMYAYIQWLDKDIPEKAVPGGTSLRKIPYMDTAANVESGRQVFTAKCQVCHGTNGQGQLNVTKTVYDYPPLWGPDSYNDGAGMFRLMKIANFVYSNMPYGTDYHHPALTVEEAWNVGAYVNSQPRPHFDASQDWKDLHKKPIDYPYGPYADNFSEHQHKYGPYLPIIMAQNK